MSSVGYLIFDVSIVSLLSGLTFTLHPSCNNAQAGVQRAASADTPVAIEAAGTKVDRVAAILAISLIFCKLILPMAAFIPGQTLAGDFCRRVLNQDVH